MSSDPRPAGSRSGRKIALIVLLLLLLPPALALFVFPLFQGQPFTSVEGIEPETIESLRVWLLNRKELDGGEDVGPYYADPADFPALLAPLQGAREVAEFPDARGPLLGEYRIRLKNGRNGTIRLYWVKGEGRVVPAYEAVLGAAAVGQARDKGAVPPARLRFQIGEHKFEDGAAAAVIRQAEIAAPRGHK